ncbi:MAG: GTPase HflX [Chitinispirillia bacterium]|jgi:GTP-binding protein HflX
MFDIQYPPPAEKVILTGLLTQNMDKNLFEEDMQEMVMLCRTAGAEIADFSVQKMEKPRPSTYLGKGKISEIKEIMKNQKIKTLVIDTQLTPGQIRNIEKKIDGKVIDRSQLILDIFAQHAKTNEARVQVELAQLRTLYPRLTHAWSHFSQQVGGIGTRGPGEKQLEVDRRLVQKKISDLKRKLKKIENSRKTQRRSRRELIRLALVGYTNVGKSSILNALSGSEVYIENQLFATLDTASRRVYIPQIGNVIISDTVGFLRRLPHHLVASFKSTLEVVREADILLIVMDLSSKWTDQQLATVNQVLKDLGAIDNRRLLLFNKADLVENPFEKKKNAIAYPESLMVSAFRPDDMKILKEKIKEIIIQYKRDKKITELIKKQTKRVSIKRK